MNLSKYINKVFCRKVSWSSYISLLWVFLGGLFLFSCTDDLGINVDNPEDGDNFTGITLYLPNVEAAAEFGASRSDDYANTRAYDTAKEYNFNTLYIVAVEAEKGTVHTFFKTTSNGVDEYDPSYNKYRINLEAGNYKIYVVSNLNRYIQVDGDFSKAFPDVATSEKAIRELILNFDPSRPLEPGFLPMACMCEDIKVGENPNDANKPDKGIVKVEEGVTKKIYADLKFLCSKVRYTILFNREDSEYAGTDDILNFHRDSASDYPFATNIRQQTAINTLEPHPGFPSEDFITTGSGSSASVANWPIPLDRYILPSIDDLKTLSESDVNEQLRAILDKLQDWDDSQNNWNTDYKDKRAWQGITYLPENLLTGNGKKTVLKFPYSVNDEIGALSPRSFDLDWNGGISRATKYDVIVWAKTKDPAQWKINVIPSEWTSQELVYQLHGPYELIVESSSVKTLSMIENAVFWFRSDVPPSQIAFESPQVSITGAYDDNAVMVDLFKGQVLKNEDGSYATNENGDYLFSVGFNLDIPYSILRKLNTSSGNSGYKKEDISFFHIVAGSLHKRIEIENLDLDPYLIVSPQTYIIDTRELYKSGENNMTIDIEFETNVEPAKDGVTLALSDPEKLISEGKGKNEVVLKIFQVTGSDGQNFLKSTTLSGYDYEIDHKTGKLRVDVSNIIDGDPFWNENNEYTLTFTLTVPVEGQDPIVKEATVTIKVRPFSSNYVIHFRDNTKPWEEPHIWVYQLLTLPVDLPKKKDNPNGELHPYAGHIVGYIENNPSSGLQWNGATQYIFSNNVGFKGWWGYGGPEINNPWEEGDCIYSNPNEAGVGNNTTMGFYMFGTPQGDGSWNYGYSYTNTANEINKKRYNFNINFNKDHEAGWDDWSCWDCKSMTPDYNGGDDSRFYTGIAMQKEYNENDGWWKYTLSGVAQPGRTMIVFANYHAPWDKPERDYTAEDNRWPGDYESGVPLFDFEDNEGWFLFNGNTTDTNQSFYDDKPVSKIIPHYFNSTYTNKMRIGVKIPDGISVSSITANNVSGSKVEENNGITYYDFSSVGATGLTMDVKVTYSDGTKTYSVSPKFFVKNSLGGYTSAKPLYLQYDPEMDIFVKWNDNVHGQGYNAKDGGNNEIGVYWGAYSSNSIMKNVTYTGKEYGNYKYNTFNPEDPSGSVTKDVIHFQLPQSSGENFHRNLKVEDLPKYYNPDHKYYQINVHKLPEY